MSTTNSVLKATYRIHARFHAGAARILFICGALALLAAWPVDAHARDRAVVEQEFNAAFELMLKNPADVTATTRYAQLAVELGDYESAIPPLERLLMGNPDLVEVRLEVGVMYFLLHANSMAKEYLNEVKANHAATPEMIRRADEYLARM